MHETVFARSILGIVLDAVKAHSGPDRELRVTYISLHVGLLDCVEPQTLKGCFSLLAEKTGAAEADLAVTVDPMRGVCAQCAQNVQTLTRRFHCPLCGADQVDWEGGRGMYIDTIQVAPFRGAEENTAYVSG